jgi:hypothetical protein
MEIVEWIQTFISFEPDFGGEEQRSHKLSQLPFWYRQWAPRSLHADSLYCFERAQRPETSTTSGRVLEEARREPHVRVRLASKSSRGKREV